MKLLWMCGASLSPFERRVVAQFDDGPHTIVGALIDARPRPSSLTRLKHHLQRGRGLYVAVMMAQQMMAPQDGLDAAELFQSRHIPALPLNHPYAPETIEALKDRFPEARLMVRSGGFGIVKTPLLSLCPEGILSYHHGDMRRYRGQPPGFWELYHGEKKMGVTVQRLEAGLDCGRPLVEQAVQIEPTDTLEILTERFLHQSIPMMRQAVDDLENSQNLPPPPNQLGKIYTHPNFRQWLTLQMRLAWRRMRRS
ncbi:MAG: hypothetical protein HQL53_02085 [Magnetococcales bacterium]|nr:hypothetical protein [Magnetococcales bacterium]